MSLQRAGWITQSPLCCVLHSGGHFTLFQFSSRNEGAGGEEHEERRCITPVSRTFSLLATLLERFHAGASGNASSKPLSQGVSRAAPVAKTNPSAVSTGGGVLPLSCMPLGWGLPRSPEDASRWCLRGPGCTLNVPSLPASLPAVAGGCTKDWPPTRRAQLCHEAPGCARARPSSRGLLQSLTECHKDPNAGRSQGNWGPLMPALLPLLSLAGSVRPSSSSSLRARLTFAGWSASPSGLIWLPPRCPSHTCFP